MKRKIVIFSIIICISLILLLLLFPKIAHEGVDLGVALFMEALFPYLLPYLILTSWFIRLTTTATSSNSPLLPFKLYTISALGGFPTGAATISQLVKQHALSRKQAAYLLGICHCPSPLFIIGYVGQDLLHHTGFSWRYLLLLHTFSILLLLVFQHKVTENIYDSTFKRDPFPFSNSVKDSMPTVAIVAATVIFFNTIYYIFIHNIALFSEQLSPIFQAAIAGILEMTNGLFLFQQALSSETFPLVAAILLTTQSISIHLQAIVLAKSANIPLKPYALIRIFYSICIPLLYALLFM